MRLKLFLALLLILIITQAAFAQNSAVNQYGNFSIQTEITTQHWDTQFYNEDPSLVVLEYHQDKSKLYGIASFENSFYQSSWYIYGGKTYPIYHQ
ncbi:MAG: hypothetical protein R6V17_02795 [Halanaerobacter sp.]